MFERQEGYYSFEVSIKNGKIKIIMYKIIGKLTLEHFSQNEINYGKQKKKVIKNAYSLHAKMLDCGIILGREKNVFRTQPAMYIKESDTNYIIESLENLANKIKYKN